MRIIKTKDLLLVETEKSQKLKHEQSLEAVPFLEEENADLWHKNFTLEIQAQNHEREIADLWYQLIKNGGNV